MGPSCPVTKVDIAAFLRGGRLSNACRCVRLVAISDSPDDIELPFGLNHEKFAQRDRASSTTLVMLRSWVIITKLR